MGTKTLREIVIRRPGVQGQVFHRIWMDGPAEQMGELLAILQRGVDGEGDTLRVEVTGRTVDATR